MQDEVRRQVARLSKTESRNSGLHHCAIQTSERIGKLVAKLEGSADVDKLKVRWIELKQAALKDTEVVSAAELYTYSHVELLEKWGAEANETLGKVALSLLAIAQRKPHLLDELNEALKIAAESVVRRELLMQLSNADIPPRGPVDKKSGSEDDGHMEARLTKLESLAEKASDRLNAIERDVAVIRSNYATKEGLQQVAGDIAVIKSNYGTKGDISDAKTAIIVSCVGTMIAMGSLAFAAAKYFS